MEKKILLDTSVYGKLVEDNFMVPLLLEKKKSNELIFYGLSIIRNELRAIPKTLFNKAKDKKIRMYSLLFYDNLITKNNHNLKMNFFIDKLSSWYFQEYKRIGGSFGKNEMKIDFLIVACATLYHLDILVSDDKRTMLSDAAIKAYSIVNKEQGFQNPVYLHYDAFREKIIKRNDI